VRARNCDATRRDGPTNAFPTSRCLGYISDPRGIIILLYYPNSKMAPELTLRTGTTTSLAIHSLIAKEYVRGTSSYPTTAPVCLHNSQKLKLQIHIHVIPGPSSHFSAKWLLVETRGRIIIHKHNSPCRTSNCFCVPGTHGLRSPK
jgi:hypothetical protein